MSNSEEKVVGSQDKMTAIMQSATDLAHFGADFEVLADHLQYTGKFNGAIQKLAVKLQQTIQYASFQNFHTEYENPQTGEYRTITLPVNLPESIGKSFNLNYYWFNMSNAPVVKNLTDDLRLLYEKTVDATTIDVINLNHAVKTVQDNFSNNNLKKEWIVVENLNDFDYDSFWSQYLERYQNRREIVYLQQSNREKQYNIEHMRITAENIKRQKDDCLNEKTITHLDLDICQTDLKNNITQFNTDLNDKQKKLSTIEEKLKKVQLQKETVETDLKQTKQSIEEIKKLNSITLSQKENLIQLKKEEILDQNKILESLKNQNTDLEENYIDISKDFHKLTENNLKIEQDYKECLTKNNDVLLKYENCLITEPAVSSEQEFRRLTKSWDDKILRERLANEEFNCHKNFLEFRNIYQEEMKRAISNVEESCREDASKLMDLNEQLGKEGAQFQQELITCQTKNAPKLPESNTEPLESVPDLGVFRDGLTQIFAWAVTFVIWPIALHNPDSELWYLLSEVSGIKIHKGPTGVVRRWTCEFLAVVLSILWWLLLISIGKKFLFNEKKELRNKNFNSQELKEVPRKITKWQKLKQKVRKFGKKLSQFLDLEEMDQEKSKVTYVARGGAVAPLLQYHDFLLFVTIHTVKISNYSVIETTSLDSKLLQLNKNQSRFNKIWDKLISVLGPIVLVLAMSSAQLPNNSQTFHNFRVTPQIEIVNNSTMSLEMYPDTFQNQVESRVMTFAKAELEAESNIETQIENPKIKPNSWRKKLKRFTKSKRKSHFAGRKFKRIKQVGRLSDLPSLENLENDDIISTTKEQQAEPSSKISRNKKVTND